jgi:hypothetical protein
VRDDMMAQSRRRDGGSVLLEFLSGLVVVVSSALLEGPLGSASIVLTIAGAGLLADSLRHVVNVFLAVVLGLAIAAVIYFPLVSLIND